MTPSELAKSNSEHGHQRALFAWLNMVERYGFEAAWTDRSYAGQAPSCQPVPELAWAHAIPNGGLRDKRTGAMLKAEGVKRGIPDVFVPVPMWGQVGNGAKCILYCGLYVEMKRPKSEEQGRKGTTSDVQDQAIAWLRHSGYAVSVCFDWESAAREVQSYIEAVRKGCGQG